MYIQHTNKEKRKKKKALRRRCALASTQDQVLGLVVGIDIFRGAAVRARVLAQHLKLIVACMEELNWKVAMRFLKVGSQVKIDIQ